ncbi:MAG: hypothetical protein JWQ66_3346 [Mucilaginibacter sp.]|nr:hypothetical protein [Mucilaginibacter sp.]
MKPLFFTLTSNLHLKVIPDTQVHLNGHLVISYNYNVFIDGAKDDPSLALHEKLHADKTLDPDYLGTVTFEKPGHLFTYTSGGRQELTPEEVEELIEHISHIRDNPDLWDSGDENLF